MQTYVSSIEEPPWSFGILKLLGETNWALRMVYRALRQEILGPGWSITSRFVSKCTTCNAEYDKEIAVCNKVRDGKPCGGKTRGPSEEEYQRIEGFLHPEKGKPNPDYSWKDLFASSIWHDCFCGIFWWSIGYTTVKVKGQAGVETPVNKIPSVVYVEDPEYMRFVTDPKNKGVLGNDEYFCPNCYEPDVCHKKDQAQAFGMICPNCGDTLVQTCYVQMFGAEIKARFGIDEIIVGSTDRVFPKLYPTPRPVALWKQLLSGNAMDDYNYQVYRKGSVGGVLAFPGYEGKANVDILQKQIEDQEKKQSEVDPVTGYPTTDKKIKNLLLATKEPPVLIRIMHDLQAMQSLDWQKFWRDGLASVYGVTPVFISVIESGRAGNNPRMQIDVQSRTTREGQDNLATPINTFLIPKLGIKDWILAFEKTDPKDDLRDARTQQIKFQTALIAASAGFNVRLDDFGELEISGEATAGASSSLGGLVPQAPGRAPSSEGMPRLPEEGSGLELSDHDKAVSSEIRSREDDSGLWSVEPWIMEKIKAAMRRVFR